MLKKEPTPRELVADTKKRYRLDTEEEDPELAQHGKGKQRAVYSASTDDERPTSKKLKHDERISQPVRGLHVEVLLPQWRTIVARDIAPKQTSDKSHRSHPKEKKGLEPAHANNVDYGGHDDEDKAAEENEGEELSLIDRNGSRRAPSDVSRRVPTNGLRCASASPPRNSQSGKCGPSNGATGVRRNSTPLASTQRRVMSKLPQVSKFRARVPALSAQQPAKKPHPRFRVEDLPDGSQQRFREDLGPYGLTSSPPSRTLGILLTILMLCKRSGT
ncbi:hypothetical protein BDR05DRAFT_805128 [Suillus weaverae]|nr:hypothetical protein BDR05DRAFT_805128 [Suillus weaverae]